jgi:hypothetical protein
MSGVQIPLTAFSEKLRRHVDPGAPPPLRMMGARGMVPAAPEETLMLLYQLSFDADAQVADAASKSWKELPADVLKPAVVASTQAVVLDRVVDTHGRAQDILEAVLRNANTSDATYARVARTCSESFTELIAQNEVRVLRYPAIIEALFQNEHARASTIDRLIELARRHRLTFEGLYALQAMMDDMRHEANVAQTPGLDDDHFRKVLAESKAEDERLEQAAARLSEAEQVALREAEQEKLDAALEAGEAEKDAPGSSNKAAEIGKMNIAQKVRLATLGSRSDRDLLIRDGNRLVHMAAVTSPKNQLKDIVAWSANKQIPDNVIVYIANNGKYKRNYQILINLVNNPKTPLNESVRLIPNLQPKDLANLIKNRNISGNLRRMAQALRDQRAQKRG